MRARWFVLACVVGFYGLALLGYAAKWWYAVDYLGLSEVDYLANLRESSTFGCTTLVDRRPTLLFIGDSHSYTAWDYQSIAATYPNARIGACTMGGFYVETVESVLELLDMHHVYPQQMVYGTSPRQFAEFADKQEALAAQRASIVSHYTVRDFVNDLLRHAKTGRKRTLIHTTAAKDQDAYSKANSALEKLAAAEADRYVQRFHNDSFERWSVRLADWHFTVSPEQDIRRICEFTRRHAIQLSVVRIPESPTLEAMYPPNVMRRYANVLEAFRVCATVFDPRGRQLLLDSRFFLNRTMAADYPYELVKQGVRMRFDSLARPNYEYDLDHLNLVGATLFTRFAVDQGLFRDH